MPTFDELSIWLFILVFFALKLLFNLIYYLKYAAKLQLRGIFFKIKKRVKVDYQTLIKRKIFSKV